jgi:hypothetical protein
MRSQFLYGRQLGSRHAALFGPAIPAAPAPPAGFLEEPMRRSAFPGPLAWLSAIAVHAAIVWLVAPPL